MSKSLLSYLVPALILVCGGFTAIPDANGANAANGQIDRLFSGIEETFLSRIPANAQENCGIDILTNLAEEQEEEVSSHDDEAGGTPTINNFNSCSSYSSYYHVKLNKTSCSCWNSNKRYLPLQVFRI